MANDADAAEPLQFAGAADAVEPVDSVHKDSVDSAQQSSSAAGVKQPADDRDPSFERLLAYLKESRGFDFTGYKRPSLMRRVQHRMRQVVGLPPSTSTSTTSRCTRTSSAHSSTPF